MSGGGGRAHARLMPWRASRRHSACSCQHWPPCSASMTVLVATLTNTATPLTPRPPSYGLHLRYMAVHVFHEVDRRKKDEMLNMAQSCRRICTHRANLQRLEVHK